MRGNEEGKELTRTGERRGEQKREGMDKENRRDM